MTLSSKIVALCLVMCIITSKIFAQHPDLGNAESFAIFTVNGGIGNTGATVVNGDLGTNVGSFTGFPPGIVNGQTQIANSISALVAPDVNSAYVDLQSRTTTGTLPAVLGNGMTILAGVYTLGTGAAGSINGTLNFDAAGVPTGIFIIKIDGALTSSTNINVVLLNGARASHVYWQVNGVFDLASGGIFKGTVINNGAINLLNGTDLEGRALSIAGAITFDAATASLPLLAPLAIDLQDFTAKCANKMVNVNWNTLSETNNTFFEIERSSDLKSWETIGALIGAGFSNSKNDYEFLDQSPLPNNSFYRLKFEEDNGIQAYSKIVAISNCGSALNQMRVTPNPINGSFHLIFAEISDKPIDLKLFNMQGQIVLNSLSNQSRFEVSYLPAGIYYLVVETHSQTFREKLILTQF